MSISSLITKITSSAWYHGKKYFYLVVPLSFLYGFWIKIRRFLYRLGVKKTTHLKAIVVVVGNLTVGGTGKTPLVVWLAQHLVKEGFRVGIVTRGYKGKYKTPVEQVYPKSSPEQVGDEALLLVRNTHCPVVVSKKRVQGALFLQEQLGCNLILSDDGLQHYALGRDIEVLVIDGKRRFGNGFLLPAGPLREPVSRRSEVDFCLVNGEGVSGETTMQLNPSEWVNLKNQALKFPKLKKMPVQAVTGIGNPERFFQTLSMLDLHVIPHVFPDHHLFQPSDFLFGEESVIVMTEKDAVKCFHFADERFWYLPVNALLPIGFWQLFISKVNGIVKL